MSRDRILVFGRLLKTPQWLRQDLISNDPVISQLVEETLAAMIAAASAEPTISHVKAGAVNDPQR